LDGLTCITLFVQYPALVSFGFAGLFCLGYLAWFIWIPSLLLFGLLAWLGWYGLVCPIYFSLLGLIPFLGLLPLSGLLESTLLGLD
jgi:hypothetical protein